MSIYTRAEHLPSHLSPADTSAKFLPSLRTFTPPRSYSPLLHPINPLAFSSLITCFTSLSRSAFIPLFTCLSHPNSLPMLYINLSHQGGFKHETQCFSH